MCGFAALYFHTPATAAAPLIQRLTEQLSHRGPDDAGYYIDQRVALGHRRLSIIDLSEAGHQPMWSADGRYGIVYNGEIYNYQSLRSQLAGYPFRSQSDTEVLLAGFAAWGTGLLARLNGIFAFALYDRQEEVLYLVRDRFGVKPLYYYPGEGFVVAASEQRPIIHSGLFEKRIYSPAIADYVFDGAVCGHRRICDGIRELPAGHFLQIRKGEVRTPESYHLFFEGIEQREGITLEEARQGVKTRLYEAVERQLVSDVPLGAFLSGGIDSAALVAVMSEVSPRKPMTFTIGFKEAKFDESGYAALVANKFNTEHTVITLDPDAFLEALPHALNALDTPTMDGVNTYLVSKLTRQSGVTVALSGLGGDELFAGYPSFRRYHDWSSHPFWHFPQWMRRLGGGVLSTWGPSSKLRRIGELIEAPVFDIAHIYPKFRNVFDRQTVGRLYGAPLPPNPVVTFLERYQSELQSLPLLSQYSVAEMIGYTQHMLLKDTDQMSMASGLEVRVPFFDNELVRYVLSVPDRHKYPHTPKPLLVSALGGLLPSEVVHRPKMGFTLPWEEWLRGPLSAFCEERLVSLCDRGLLNADYLRLMWSDFRGRRKDVLWSHIWMFVVLEHWLSRNMDP